MRPIDADEIIKVAEHAYHEWNLAMAAADTNRQVNLTYKMQDLCKAVKAVAEAAPTIDPESLRPQGKLIDKIASYLERDGNWETLKACWKADGRSDELRELLHRAAKGDAE